MTDHSDVKDSYRLSPMQRSILFHDVKDRHQHAYIGQTTFQIDGELDIASLEQSFNAIISKYDVLRTIFVYQNVKEPMQVVLKERKSDLHYEDISAFSREEQNTILLKYKEQDRTKGFDLTRDILMRLSVMRLGETSYQLIVSIHHIIVDDRCLGFMYKDLFEQYKCRVRSQPLSLETTVSYSRYIRWLEEQDEEEAKQFWKKYLQDVHEASFIPQRYTDQDTQADNEGLPGIIEQKTFSFSEEMTESMVALAKSCRVTLHHLFQTIWGILLQKYNNTEEAVFGSVISGRPPEISQVESIVGIFMNTIPVRIKTSDTKTFRALVKEVQDSFSQSEKYGYLTLADLQKVTGTSHSLIEHAIAFENLPTGEPDRSYKQDEPISPHDITIMGMEDGYEKTNYAFSLQAQLDRRLIIKISYQPAVYSDSSIEAVFQHINSIAVTVLHRPDIPVKDISVVSPVEYQQLLYHFNQLKIDLPEGKTVHELFEEKVLDQPNAEAIVCNGQTLTYSQLNAHANQLARVLQKQGAGPDRIIGIMAEHSLHMVSGVLGIIKAGAAYMPIDPSYPSKRIEYMLEDSQTDCLLIQPGCQVPEGYQGTTILLDNTTWADEEIANVLPIHQNHHLAYVIYTSGSTGQPKGVMVEHHALVNLCFWHHVAFQTTAVDRSTKLAGFGFDASVWETFPPLLQGMTLHVIDEALRSDIYALQTYFAMHGISLAFLPTQLAVQFMELDHPSLRLLLIGGDRLQQFKPQRYAVINNYGPTENTVVTTSGVLDVGKRILSIGKPVHNHRVYIMDRSGHLQPIGVPGELCVSGKGLARGYLNRQELTAERFIQHPLFPEERIYCTGDLARWLPDGNIEYMGRLDEQVKIRGYRIEPGEIDARFMEHPAIDESLTIARKDTEGYTYLCSYLVTSATWTVPELRRHLIEVLPEYMIPAHFIDMEALPVTANGKVNRSALPEPVSHREQPFIAPITATEIKLAAIFEEILGVERIGIADHFFEMGGHSLKAMTMVSRIHKEMDVEIPLNEVFLNPTVKELAAYVDQKEPSLFEGIQKVEQQDYYPVSFAQRRMYMVQQIQKGEATDYNMPLIFEMKGKLDVPKLQKALQTLIQRHESLRTSFHMVQESLMQHVHPDVTWSMEVRDAAADTIQSELNAFIRPFCLADAPLFRAGVFCLHPERHVLILDMHHIISDGVSTQLLLGDLLQLYQDKELPKLQLQYKDYAVWQQSEAGRTKLHGQKKYWLKQLGDELPILELITDYPRPAIQEHAGDSWNFEIDTVLSGRLKQLCIQQGTTLFMLLLASYQLLLGKYTGQEDVITGSPIAGRPHADLQPIVGMFVNMLALRGKPKPNLTFTSYLSQVKDQVLQAYNNAEFPFEELIEHLDLKRDVSRHPLFDVLLSVQNIDMSEASLPHVDMTPLDISWNPSKFDMNWTVIEGKSLHITVDYSTSLFQSTTIQRMAAHFVELLRQIVDHPEYTNGQLGLIRADEQQRITEIFNDTVAWYPREQTIHGLFEEQVTLHPERTALIMGKQQMTYRELNEHANRLAHALLRRGVQPDQIIGLVSERSPDMIVAILAILKAGAAYLPMDPSHPAGRIRQMLADSQATLLLVQRPEFLPSDCGYEGKTLLLSEQPGKTDPVYNPSTAVRSEHLAYVMYTSGSTGKPKGVMVTHRNVIKTVINNGYLDMSPEDRVLQLSNYAFDGSTFDLYEALLHGAALVLVSREELLDPVVLMSIIREQNISVALMTVSLFNAMVEIDLDGLAGFRKLVFGGEQASRIHVEKALLRLGEGRLVNAYGPTETTVCATTWTVDRSVLDTGLLPIGRPMNNTSLYILNSSGQTQPIGLAGELCISGEGVSRGYLNRPELTAESFIDNPWLPGTRIYRTGDLARWLPDGTVEFLGRIDEQVKIRGNRIELGEIEARLLEHPAVRETIVTAVRTGQTYSGLCAYVVADGEWNMEELNAHLGAQLPKYMIPGHFIGLDHLPLTPNGKVDKRALPVPQKHESRERVAPRNETETTLLGMVAEVLGLSPDQLSVSDNLFDLGGHSLSILKMIGKAHAIGWKLEMKDFYTYGSLEELAGKIETGTQQHKKDEDSPYAAGIRIPVPVVRVQDRPSQLHSVLLLGATGFLGIHLLHELLSSTAAEVTCLVRAENRQQGWKRLMEKLNFYFSIMYTQDELEQWMSRIHIIHGDVANEGFGLEHADLDDLGQSVDTVIHTAALVKHYGFYEEFERVNVHGTHIAANFCAKYRLPLHYVSTLSVSGTYAPDSSEILAFTERDFYIGQDYRSNVYLRSKFEAESILIGALADGLDVSIYRVGNLTGRYTDGMFQENIQENMFYLSLKAIISMEGVEPGIMQELVDLTPVDACAEAIVKLVRSPSLQERVFHLHNPHYVSYAEIYDAFIELGFKRTTTSREEMRHKWLMLQSQDEAGQMLAGIVATLFEPDGQALQANIHVDISHTRDVLQGIGFAFMVPDLPYIRKLVAYAVQTGFISPQHQQISL